MRDNHESIMKRYLIEIELVYTAVKNYNGRGISEAHMGLFDMEI